MPRPDDEITRLLTEKEPLIRKLARRHAFPGIPLDDLMQEGRIGLLRAFETFDARRGAQFDTWAWLWINDAVERAVWRERRSMGLPHREYRLLQRMRVAKRSLSQELEREPSIKELGARMGLPEERVKNLVAISEAPMPLDELNDRILQSNAAQLCVAPSQAMTLEEDERAERFGKAITRLSSRQQLVLTKHCGLGREKEQTLKQIALDLKISAPRVSQIQNAAMRKLKHELSHFSQPSPSS